MVYRVLGLHSKEQKGRVSGAVLTTVSELATWTESKNRRSHADVCDRSLESNLRWKSGIQAYVAKLMTARWIRTAREFSFVLRSVWEGP